MLVDLDSVNEYSQGYDASSFDPIPQKPTSLHEAVLTQPTSDGPFSRQATIKMELSTEDIKARRVALHSSNMRAMGGKAGGGFEIGADAKWGGKEGFKMGGHIQGNYQDKNGNYLEGKVKQYQDGKGEGHVAAGHKENRGK